MGGPLDGLRGEEVQAGACCHIGERPIAVVAHELVVAAGTGSDHHVDIVIVVEIAPCARPGLVVVG